jgi:hypothetical protein
MQKRLLLAVLLVGATSAWGQQVISAHSGVIHFVEGQVSLDGQPVSPKFGEFPEVKNGQTLEAADGRAEVLLTPGVILRIAENSSFQMVSNNRTDTRLSVLTGSAIVEVGELLPSNAITVMYNGAHIELVKKGIFRIDSDPGKLRVYDGEARVTSGTQTLVARKGREVLLGAVLDMNGFDVKDTDAFLRWASRRSESLAQANISSARTASGLGYSGSSYGSGYGYGSGMMGGGGAWAYNPFYGMFTYMPYGNGMYYSPFGYPFYSPSNVGYYVPSGFSGSAFPISASGTSPHYNGNGTVTMAPRGSYGSTNGGATRGSSGNTAVAGGGSSSGGMSSGSSSSVSSGAASHAGGASGGMGGRGK